MLVQVLNWIGRNRCLHYLVSVSAMFCMSTACAERLTGSWPQQSFARGIVYSSWDGSYSNEAAWRQHLEDFKRLGINWIEIITFAHQPDVNEPTIIPTSASRWPVKFVRSARAAGFKILLKPHVWSRQFYDGSNRWRGSINMRSEAAWARWFSAYEAFILREAKFAETHGIEMLSIGLEYVEATRQTADWYRIIKRVRTIYSGQLTYAADGNHELGHVQFWDQLDVIGVDAYFALGDNIQFLGAPLILAWLRPLRTLAVLSAKYRKPIIFTEAGFPSVAGATARPWQWPTGREVVDENAQALGYNSLLSVFTRQAWFHGVFWWKWYEQPEANISLAHDYAPAGKLAESVLGYFYKTRLEQPDAPPQHRSTTSAP
ncbi:MAG: glycoside hydrolase family 113 [Bradymonadia bacterium]